MKIFEIETNKRLFTVTVEIAKETYKMFLDAKNKAEEELTANEDLIAVYPIH